MWVSLCLPQRRHVARSRAAARADGVQRDGATARARPCFDFSLGFSERFRGEASAPSALDMLDVKYGGTLMSEKGGNRESWVRVAECNLAH